jgi:hypothetical protein
VLTVYGWRGGARRRAAAQDATKTALAILRRRWRVPEVRLAEVEAHLAAGQHRARPDQLPPADSFFPEAAELDDECVVSWYLAEMWCVRCGRGGSWLTRHAGVRSNRRAASFAAGYNSWRAEKVEEKRRRGKLDHLTDRRSQPPPVVASSQWHSYPPPIFKDSTWQALETNW